MGNQDSRSRIETMIERGVQFVDPSQVYIDAAVRPERVCAGVVIHPGCRLIGDRTFIGPNSEVGCEGPATLHNAVLGEGVRVDAGFLDGAVLLDRSRAGWGAHFRPGTLLEEEASTAHAVGLKHTILLSFVTLGSLINFCDCLMAGGRSRQDHSEVGSGFIHFNFTPWGERGDKATPSLVGDVVSGVFLRERRIFLGGSGGLVGPGKVGYGAIVGAGQVTREPVPEDTILVRRGPDIELRRKHGSLGRTEPKLSHNLEYIAQLRALRSWYEHVRLARARTDLERAVVTAALETIDICVAERVARVSAFATERGLTVPRLALAQERSCPLPIAQKPELSHLAWVSSLTPQDVEVGRSWLEAIVTDVLEGSDEPRKC